MKRLKEEVDMPRGDRMGPAGTGPRSGRAVGYCAGFDVPGFANPGPRGGRGFGRGRGGFGRGFGGFRHGFGWGGPAYGAPWVPDAATEQQVLKSQAEALRAQLRAIESRLTGGERPEGAE